MVSSSVNISDVSIKNIAKSLAKVIKPNDGGGTIFGGSSDTSKTGGVDTAAILNSTKAKYDVQIDKKQAKTDKFTTERDALSNLKSISSTLLSSIQTLKTSTGTDMFNSFVATGAPSGTTIIPTSAAKAGSHTVSVSSVASKQTMIIQSTDAIGNPMPFRHNLADVTAGAAPLVSPGCFTRGKSFIIFANSDNSAPSQLATITLANQPYTLQAIADLINNATAVGVNPAINTILTATVVSDALGDKLVLESINPGIAGNFYISSEDITGTTNGDPILGGGVAQPSAISSLSVAPSYEDVKSIDIYTQYGYTFRSATDPFTTSDAAITLAAGLPPLTLNEEQTSFKIGTWNIGMGFINFGAPDITSLPSIVNKINSEQNATGVTAEIVGAPGGGFIIRVTASHGTPLNYSPASTVEIFGAPAAANRISHDTSSDTLMRVDGIEYNARGSLTLSSISADIASITVSEPTPLSRFSITQDVAKLTTSISALVDTINDAQQFIAQQQQEDAPLRSNNTLSQLKNMINSLTSNSTDVMSLSRMGITWNEYTPTSAEKKDGLVPARYLSINPTTFNNIITSNFDDVKTFFVGGFSHATTPDAKASVVSMSNIISIPQFDLKVTCIAAGPPPTLTAAAMIVGVPTLMNAPVWLGGTKFLITGSNGTAFEGLSINYDYTGAGGLATLFGLGGAGHTITNINVYNGAAPKLSTSLTSYLDTYGTMEKAIADKNNKIKTSNNETKSVISKRDKAIARAQAKIQKMRMQTIMLENLKKQFENRNR